MDGSERARRQQEEPASISSIRVHHERNADLCLWSVAFPVTVPLLRCLREGLSLRPEEVEKFRLQLQPSRSEMSRLCLHTCAPTSVHVGTTLSLKYAHTQTSTDSGSRAVPHRHSLCGGAPRCFHKSRSTIHHGRRCEAPALLRSHTLPLALRLGDGGDLELMIYDSSGMEEPATHVETLQGEIYDNSL